MCFTTELNSIRNQSVFFLVANKLQAWTSWWAALYKMEIYKIWLGDWVRALVVYGLTAVWLLMWLLNVVCSGERGCVHSLPHQWTSTLTNKWWGIKLDFSVDFLAAGWTCRKELQRLHMSEQSRRKTATQNIMESVLSRLRRSTPLDLKVQCS